MSSKVTSIIGWVLTVALAALFIWSAYWKFNPSPEMQAGLKGMGLSLDTVRMIGIVELVSILLFIIPRTGVLGSMLLAAYVGGAIATHLEHATSIVMPVVVECVIFITAILRFPEMAHRLFGRSV